MSEQIMESNEQNNEISLLDIIAVLFKYKWFIFILTIFGAIGVFTYCWVSIKLPPDKTYMPNLYKPQAEMLINNSTNSNSLSSALSSSGLGSLVNMLGASSSNGPSNSSLAQYLVTSPSIQDAIIDKFYRENIEKTYKEHIEAQKAKGKYDPDKDIWKFPLIDTRNMLLKKIETNYDSSTGIFKIAVEDKDSQLACDIINYTVSLLEKRFEEIGVDKNKLAVANLEKNIDIAYKNIIALQNRSQVLDSSLSNPYGYNDSESTLVMDTNMLQLELKVQEEIYASLKTQYETMKVTMASEQPVFQILEYAQIPDKKSGPSRAKLCIIVTFAAFFISIFLSFLLNAINNIKNDPEAMSKLHPNKKVRK